MVEFGSGVRGTEGPFPILVIIPIRLRPWDPETFQFVPKTAKDDIFKFKRDEGWFEIINKIDNLRISHLYSEPVGIIATEELRNRIISLIKDGLRLNSSMTDFFQFIGHIRTCDTWREF